MSSRHVTVARLIETLRQYPSDLLVAVPSPCPTDALFEGILDGPVKFDVVPVTDVRTGFNPVGFDGWTDPDWNVLLIRSSTDRAFWAVSPNEENNFLIKGAAGKRSH